MRFSSTLKKLGWHAIHRLTGIHLATRTKYDNWAVYAASFQVPIEKIRPKIPTKLQLIETAPKTTIVILRAIQVTKAQGLTPYNEFSVEVPTFYEENGTKLLGSYILYMPVTSEEARWGGVEIVGLPKFIADISFEDSTYNLKCKVQGSDKDIISLEVKKIPTHPQSWDWYIYGIRDNRLLRTHIYNEGQRGTTNESGGATFSLGKHPIAKDLKELEISPLSIQHEISLNIRSIEDIPLEIEKQKNANNPKQKLLA